MTVNLIIPVQCDKNTCNSSLFRTCEFVARNPGSPPGNHYCRLFGVDLSGEIYAVDCSYKELQRCKECKKAQRGGTE